VPIVLNGPQGSGTPPSITSNGYAIMNVLADGAIVQYVGGVTLKSGYLGIEYMVDGTQLFTGANDLPVRVEMHWYAYGQYSDGITQPIANANVLQLYGT
jgi:hypothetical protein